MNELVNKFFNNKKKFNESSFAKISREEALTKISSYMDKDYRELGSIWYRGGYILIDIFAGAPRITLNDIPSWPCNKKIYLLDCWNCNEDEKDKILDMNWIDAICWYSDFFKKEELLNGTIN